MTRGKDGETRRLRRSLTTSCMRSNGGLIGPFRGGRVVAVAGDPVRDQVFYFGSTGGGVWKTTDGGVYWENISDGFFKRASVGAIAVAESDPNVIYVGMGEVTIRGNVSHGDGVYKSTDAGKTWTHLRARGDAPHRQSPHPPAQSGSRLRRGARPRARAERGARRLSLEGRRHRPGSRCSSAARRPGRSISSWTRTTRASSTPRSGRRGASRTTWSAAARAAASSNPPTAATPGRRSRATRACRRACSARSASPSRPPSATASGRSSRRRTAGSSARTTAARPGSGSPRIAICGSAPGTTCTSTPTRRTRRRSGC